MSSMQRPWLLTMQMSWLLTMQMSWLQTTDVLAANNEEIPVSGKDDDLSEA